MYMQQVTEYYVTNSSDTQPRKNMIIIQWTNSSVIKIKEVSKSHSEYWQTGFRLNDME